MPENLYSLPRPFFLPGQHGRIFAVYHEPVGDIQTWGNILVVPAFNEEMNRCRSMVTIQAQALAKIGLGTMVFDLYGTGESDGEYGDARWEIWGENIRQCIDWIDASQPGGCIALLGIRLGVPLALTALQQESSGRALIAWQAIADGKSYLTQFMRMRIAANMDRTDIPKETTSGMRANLADGKSIEVAGYEIHPELANAIENVRLGELTLSESVPAVWFEKASGEEVAVSTASEKTLDAWRQAGWKVDGVTFDGPAFWALHDRYVAPELVEKTSEWIQSIRRPK